MKYFQKILYWGIKAKNAQNQSNLRFFKFCEKLTQKTLLIFYITLQYLVALKLTLMAFLMTMMALKSRFNIYEPKVAKKRPKIKFFKFYEK